MTDLLGHFGMTITTFQMLCNEIAGGLVMLFHSTNHMTVLIRKEQFIRQVHFHLSLFALTLFHTRQKRPQVKIPFFLWIKGFFFPEFANSITHFSCDTSKCALKQGDGNSYWFIYSADSLTKHSNCTLHLCQINSTGRLKKECLSSMIISPITASHKTVLNVLKQSRILIAEMLCFIYIFLHLMVHAELWIRYNSTDKASELKAWCSLNCPSEYFKTMNAT